MNKPNDIPQDIWDSADAAWEELTSCKRERDAETEVIARIVLAERLRCVKKCISHFTERPSRRRD